MTFLANLFGAGRPKKQAQPQPPKTTDTAIQDRAKEAADRIRLAKGYSSTLISTDLGHVG
jgi:hypothetical protein